MMSPKPVTPVAILAQKLARLAEQASADPAISTEIVKAIGDCHRLAAGLDPYLEACTTPPSPALVALDEKTRTENWSQHFSAGETARPLEQEMLSGHVEGQLLKLIVHMTRAKRILEIGLFTGYSALAMAEALPHDGQLIGCEVDAYVAAFAERCFQASPHGSKISIKCGPALTTLQELAAAGEAFDFVFIDADKSEYGDYLQLLLKQNLWVPGGFMAVDNTLLQGQPYLDPDCRSANGEAIARFNRQIAEDNRVEQVLLPLRDGVTLLRRV